MSSDGFVVAMSADRAGTPRDLGPNRNMVKIAATDTDGRFSLFEYQGAARGGPPLHLHERQDEFFVVGEGRYLFRVGDIEHRLGPGETIFLPRGVPHSFAQISEQGRVLYGFQPAGDMEAFFDELAKIDPAQVDGATIAAIFERHGMQVVGPPLLTETL